MVTRDKKLICQSAEALPLAHVRDPDRYAGNHGAKAQADSAPTVLPVEIVSESLYIRCWGVCAEVFAERRPPF